MSRLCPGLDLQLLERVNGRVFGEGDLRDGHESRRQHCQARDPANLPRLASVGSANDETLFVQEGPVFGSELNPPISRVFSGHRLTGVRAVPTFRTGPNAKLHRLSQAILAIPTMFNRGVLRGLHARVEKQLSWRDRADDRVATPISGR